MPHDAALRQLTEMGIPGGRANAALRRAKGDAMSAAERVFAGEFDDIPSDDEGFDQDASPKQVIRPLTPDQTPFDSPSVRPADEGMPKSLVAFGDRLDEESQSDDVYGESSMDQYIHDDDLPGERLLSDPYAGVFFSKERTEHILEPAEEVEWTELAIPQDEESGSLTRVRVLGRGEWMSGCPEGSEQSYLFQLYSMLEEPAVCPRGCGTVIARHKSDFFALFPSFIAYVGHLRQVIRQPCPQCNGVICMACGEAADEKATHRPESLRAVGTNAGKQKNLGEQIEFDELLHCLPIQGVLIGVGLHMIEQAFASPKSLSDAILTPASKTPPSKKRKTDVIAKLKKYTIVHSDDFEESSEDVEYSFAGSKANLSANGTGYAGSGSENRSGQIAAEKAQRSADIKTAELLSQVRVYLPSLSRPSGPRSSDHLVHATALAHLRRRSGFVNDLLRNDSLLDMSNRGEWYRVLFDWLETVSSHESLASMLAMPQMRPVSSVQSSADPKQLVVTYEGASSPRELLESCVIQAQAALKGLEATAFKEHFGQGETEEELQMSTERILEQQREQVEARRTDENTQLKEFCERIITSATTIDKSLVETKGRPFVQRMRESLPRLPDIGTAVEEQVTDHDNEDQIIRIYEEWATKARFQYCDMSYKDSDDLIAYRHIYDKDIRGIENMDAPRRSLAIAKELAILTRNLPVAWHSSIFLRVDEARVDCIKAMIVGPEGTPYENGCFIFDIFLPISYNLKSPLVKSMTTNGGRYRFNPNLYADGKVCLSLLGTWSGPGWVSGQSTLLQVLVSIQSLILCEEPYLNEPGWAGSGGTPQSKGYSANVRRMTMVDAIANNIKSPPVPFENEIKTHFRMKANYIRRQLDRWKELDDGRSINEPNNGYTGDQVANPKLGASETAFDKGAKEVRKLLDKLEGKVVKSTEYKLESVGGTGGKGGKGKGGRGGKSGVAKKLFGK